jgi:L-lactate dehydrogenase
MKVSIIGGGGLVGSCAGFALQAGKIVREINLVDVNQDLCQGQALDILHGASLLADQKVTATGTEGVKDADVVVITAGLRRKPDESRLDLINRNVALFRNILADMKQQGLRNDAIVFVVSNPVDVLTYLAIKELGLPPTQVIGLGTVLDTTRLRSLLAQRLDVPPTQVQVTILGEHGDSMVPIWSNAQIAGLPLEKYPGVTSPVIAEIEKQTRGSGAEVAASCRCRRCSLARMASATWPFPCPRSSAAVVYTP